MVQLAGTKALVRDACERKLALEKLVLTFSLFFLFNSFALEFTIAHPTPPPLPALGSVCGICLPVLKDQLCVL